MDLDVDVDVDFGCGCGCGCGLDMDVNIEESTSAMRALNVKLCLVHEVIVLVSHTEHKHNSLLSLTKQDYNSSTRY